MRVSNTGNVPDLAVGIESMPERISPIGVSYILPITIKQLNYGYIIEVGCQTFAIESASLLIAKLSEYISNPGETEKKWNDGKLF